MHKAFLTALKNLKIFEVLTVLKNQRWHQHANSLWPWFL